MGAGSRRIESLAITFCAMIVALAVALSGFGWVVDNALQGIRDTIRSRPATGRLLLVELDARSLGALDRWPWSRSLYATAIDTLAHAGARTVAFDVDFSARSTANEDDALARAVARSPVPIVMPTFRQAETEAGRRQLENLPIPPLRRRTMLASVNIYADADGLVRSYPYGITTAGVPRPSIGAILADGAGSSESVFPIDGAIDPLTVPRVSFVDLIRGRVPPRLIAGRSVLIGATAIELGDRYPMPRHGIVPGPIIQLLAAETLLQGTSPTDRGALLPAGILVVALPFALMRRRRVRIALLAGAAGALLLAPLCMEAWRMGSVAVAPALAGLVFALVSSEIAAAVRAARAARLVDADTGLANGRALLAETSARHTGAVVVLRIDNYGDIAGVLGRARATDFVAQIADRLKHVGDCAIHRVEENALGWVVSDAESAAQTGRLDVAAALLRLPFDIAGRRIEPVTGFGLAALNSNGDVVAHAALAADRALARGARFERHSADLRAESDWRLGLASELDRAMAAGDIWVAYQPKLDIASRRIVGSEALVRWRHATRGAIPPDAFIPALEETGRITDLTLFVLERALTDWTDWAAAGAQLGVAVNISALLPSDPEFMTRFDALLARFPAPIPFLTLEVTESATMTDPDAAVAALEQLTRRGIRLAIDDYGTGQSTLSYLKRLPASEIKIDKSFVLGLETNRGDQAMVRSTIALAHELGYEVVAEGIETASGLDILASYGCDVGQGWHIGKPMQASELIAIAGSDQRRAA